MTIPVIITGAVGRMGKTLIELVQADSDFALAGLLERPEMLAGLSGYDCPTSARPEELLSACKNAVIIDFTAPEATMALARVAAQYGHALVIGTTGLTDAHKTELAALAHSTRIFWSPNMSVGVNVLCEILPKLAAMLGAQYDMEMVELHHNRKKDSPSGTALRMAECLAKARGWNLPDVACCCREGIIGERPQAQIGIQTVRGGDVVGVHTVYFMGSGERIEVTHQAHSRENFAQGALRAAKWLILQKQDRLYSMQDIF